MIIATVGVFHGVSQRCLRCAVRTRWALVHGGSIQGACLAFCALKMPTRPAVGHERPTLAGAVHPEAAFCGRERLKRGRQGLDVPPGGNNRLWGRATFRAQGNAPTMQR